MVSNSSNSFKNLIKMKNISTDLQEKVNNNIKSIENKIYSITDNPRQKNINVSMKSLDKIESNLPIFQSIMLKLSKNTQKF